MTGFATYPSLRGRHVLVTGGNHGIDLAARYREIPNIIAVN